MIQRMPQDHPAVQSSVRRRRWAGLVLAACLALPAAARADDDAIPDHDARLDGYDKTMIIDAGGTSSTYIFLALLSIAGIGVLFISSKRTHLD